MKQMEAIKRALSAGEYHQLLEDIYISPAVADLQIKRYIHALDQFKEIFGDGKVSIYSAPGRSEIGGNHTDHQHGNVLAASIHLDALAVVRPNNSNTIRFQSEGYELIEVSITKSAPSSDNYGTTQALVAGVVAGFMEEGYTVGGFDAYITSDVLIGAGLSSSAAFETLVGTILSGLYNEMKVSPVEIAKIGQSAENVYFGKPCGLMDQMACSVGSLVHIDFIDAANPKVEKVDFDLSGTGYCLCVTDTKGSHANLTPDYAAIPDEMHQAARIFGKDYLGEVTLDEIYQNLPKIRKTAGDRAALRAIHFVEENIRAKEETRALKENHFEEFLKLVKASGDSSFKYLQNVYTTQDIHHQNVSVALAFSDHILKDTGVSRVHGGGFAGTMQAFVPLSFVETYKAAMEQIFGENSCTILHIRKYGGIKVI